MSSWKDIMGRNNYANIDRMRGKVIVGTIESIEINEKGFKGDGKHKLVIDLDSTDMRFTLNLESCKNLAAAYGDEYDEWVGYKVQAKLGKVPFGKSGTVDAIIVAPIEKRRKAK